MKKILLMVYSLILVVVLVGCSNTSSDTSGESTKEASKDIFAMDTYMTIKAYGQNCNEAIEQAVEEINRIDKLLSTGDSESEISVLNNNGNGTLSDDSAFLMKQSLQLYKQTNGAFNIAIYPIMEAWGFTNKNYNVVSEETLQTLLPKTNISLIDYNNKTKKVSFKEEGVKIDFGGIAKGYTSMKIAEIFKENGITSGMINLGGNVQVVGSKVDGSKWNVAIQNPNDSDGYLGVIKIEDVAVITSGGYERYFEEDGITYHHIIDPATGKPANNGLKSVTIVSLDGTLADGLSTSLFVMGKDKAVTYWQEHKDEFDMILCDENNVLYVTDGIKDDFTSDLVIEYIK